MNINFPVMAAAAGWLVSCVERTRCAPLGNPPVDFSVPTTDKPVAPRLLDDSTAQSLIKNNVYDALQKADSIQDFFGQLRDKSIFAEPEPRPKAEPEPAVSAPMGQIRAERAAGGTWGMRCEQYDETGCILGKDPDRPKLCKVDSSGQFGKIWVDCTEEEYNAWVRNNLPRTHMCGTRRQTENGIWHLGKTRCTEYQYKKQQLAHLERLRRRTTQAPTTRPVRSEICRGEIFIPGATPLQVFSACTPEEKQQNIRRHGNFIVPANMGPGSSYWHERPAI